MNNPISSSSTPPPILSLKNISKIYETQNRHITIFEGLDLDIHQGEMVGLVAPSGTGKSTLLHIAGLLDDATSGDIYIEGVATHSLSDKEKTKLRTKSIGFVYQFHHLLPELTALENVAMPLRIYGHSRQDALQMAHELLSPMELTSREDHRPAEMSGGEQQRTAIARAMANAPALLLADEPTGNLDPETADIIFTQMRDMAQKRGHSALIATHNHELAKKMDRCITLHEGKIKKIDL